MLFLLLKLIVGWSVLLYLNFLLDKPLVKLITTRPMNPSSRKALLVLTFFDFRNVVFGSVIAALSYGIALSGGLNGLNDFMDFQGAAANFVIWLIEPSFLNLLLMASFGFLYGFLGRSFGFTILLSFVFIFPGLVSAPTAAVLIFSEMTGQALSFFRRLGEVFPERAVKIRLGISCFCLLAFWAGGGALRDALQFLQLNRLLLGDRILEVSWLLAVLVFTDSLLASITFHYYHQRTKGQ